MTKPRYLPAYFDERTQSFFDAETRKWIRPERFMTIDTRSTIVSRPSRRPHVSLPL